MNRHLNMFVPYERPSGHEDQLTRAAMIVMRAIPLARDALLARIGMPPSGRLPEVTLDMQTRHVLEERAVVDAETASLRRLVSVFLSPDERLDLSESSIRERIREQRLDGVLRFGDDLVVVIESKVVGEAPSEQASELRLRGVEVEEASVVALGWHDLLQDWWSLLERGLLAPAERILVEDLIALAEMHFAHVLPFTTLAQSGGHDLRWQRRLMALLREATGIEEIRRRPPHGAEVMLDQAIGTTSTQRIALEREDDRLVLSTWPAELKPQAEALYRSGRLQGLTDLANADDWDVVPNPHLAYRGAITRAQRLYLTCRLELAEYVRRWTEQDFPKIGAHSHDEIRSDLWPWLRDRNYASPEDDDRLDAFLEGLGQRDAHLRPGIAVRRIWRWTEAEELDERDALVPELREEINRLLTALAEPLLPHP